MLTRTSSDDYSVCTLSSAGTAQDLYETSTVRVFEDPDDAGPHTRRLASDCRRLETRRERLLDESNGAA